MNPNPDTKAKTNTWELIILSSNSSANLYKYTKELGSFLGQQADINLSDLAYSLQKANKDCPIRRAVVTNNLSELISILQNIDAKKILNSNGLIANAKTAFMFTGLGDQYVDMGLGLYQNLKVFRQAVDLCCEILKPSLGLDLKDVLYPKGTEKKSEEEAKAKLDLRSMLFGRSQATDESTQKLNQTYISQPLMFVIEYALAQSWISLGISPQSMVGYSIGEYVAACLAGVFSLEDGLKLIAGRAKMMQDLPAGAMMGVALSEQEVLPMLGSKLSIAAINGASLCVVSGPLEEVGELETQLTSKGVVCRRLQTTHAFHSKMMEPIIGSVIDLTKSVKLNTPKIPYVSTVTGTWMTDSDALDPSYWARHMCQSVRFTDALKAFSNDLNGSNWVLLEVGPGQTLSTTTLQNQERDSSIKQVLSSMRSSFYQQSDLAFLLNTLAKLWLSGLKVNWENISTQEPKEIALPDYLTAEESLSEKIKGVLESHSKVKEALVVEYLSTEQKHCDIYVLPKKEFSSSVKGHLRYKLPNNMFIAHLNRNETDHLYHDIFANQAYIKHGIKLPEGACIFDVGANIGMFSLFISQFCKNPKIFAFEPIPPIFDILQINLELYSSNYKLFNMGISNREYQENFTFYPKYTVMSGVSSYANASEDLEVVKTVMVNERKNNSHELDILLSHADDLFAGRFEATTYECKLTSLSNVIKQESVEQIDLLKIDVQRAEEDVLNGISEQDWPKIKQIVIEVHDKKDESNNGRVSKIVQQLKNSGFKVIVEQDELFEGTDHYNIFALREDKSSMVDAGLNGHLSPVREFDTTKAFISEAELNEHLAANLSETFSSTIVLLENIPRLENGEVNYQELESISKTKKQLTTSSSTDTLLGSNLQTLDLFYTELWEQSLLPAPIKNSSLFNQNHSWVLFIDDSPFCLTLANRLKANNQHLTTIKLGDNFQKLAENNYCFNPNKQNEYSLLTKQLLANSKDIFIAYLWSAFDSGIAEENHSSTLLSFVKALKDVKAPLPVQIKVVNSLESSNINSSLLETILWSACQNISRNFSNVKCSYYDLDITNASSVRQHRLIDYFISEYSLTETQLRVRYQNNQRFIKKEKPVELVPSSLFNANLANGNYLVIADKGSVKLSSNILSHLCLDLFVVDYDSSDLSTPKASLESSLAKLSTDFSQIKGVFYCEDLSNTDEQGDLDKDSKKLTCIYEKLNFLVEFLRDKEIDFCLLQSFLPVTHKTTSATSYYPTVNLLNSFVKFHNNIESSKWMSINYELDLEESNGDGKEFYKQMLGLVFGMFGRATDIRVRKQKGISGEATERREREGKEGSTSKYKGRPNLTNSYVAASNETEQVLVDIWEKTLSTRPIGVNDIFFELGGHSILAIQVVSQIKTRLEKEISLREFFEHPTISELASIVR